MGIAVLRGGVLDSAGARGMDDVLVTAMAVTSSSSFDYNHRVCVCVCVCVWCVVWCGTCVCGGKCVLISILTFDIFKLRLMLILVYATPTLEPTSHMYYSCAYYKARLI